MKKKQNKKGFTLVETLVAVSILVLVVTGAFSAAQIGISSSIHSKEQIIAFYLAQEGVEKIRNMRDENGLNVRPWLQGVANDSSDPCYFGKACLVDVPSNVISECTGGTCPPLRQNRNTGFYTYTSPSPVSKYRRTITLEEVRPGEEVAILVVIQWSKGIMDREFQVRENIFNWQ